MAQSPGEVSALLERAQAGDRRASSQLFRVVYGELRAIAGHLVRHERPGQDLQATALVNEMYVRVFGGTPPPIHGSGHFYHLAARAMRNILIDQARKNQAGKREGLHVALDNRLAGEQVDPDGVAVLCLALRRLAKHDERAARAFELHYLLNWEPGQIASSLAVTRRTVERDLVAAKLWLKREMSSPGKPGK